MWPTSVVEKSTRRAVIPPAFMSAPASRKNGMASSRKESIPVTIFCGHRHQREVPGHQEVGQGQHAHAEANGHAEREDDQEQNHQHAAARLRPAEPRRPEAAQKRRRLERHERAADRHRQVDVAHRQAQRRGDLPHGAGRELPPLAGEDGEEGGAQQEGHDAGQPARGDRRQARRAGGPPPVRPAVERDDAPQHGQPDRGEAGRLVGPVERAAGCRSSGRRRPAGPP